MWRKVNDQNPPILHFYNTWVKQIQINNNVTPLSIRFALTKYTNVGRD